MHGLKALNASGTCGSGSLIRPPLGQAGKTF